MAGLFGHFEKRSESVAQQQNNATWKLLNEPQNTSVDLDERKALADSAVDTCVSTIADTLAGFPIDLYQRGGDGGVEEVEKPAWLVQPNPNETLLDTMKATWVSLLLRGNAYWLLIHDDAGELLNVDVLHPDRVEVYKEGGLVKYTIDGERELDGKPIVNGVNILHFKSKALPGEYKGLSPIELHRRTINGALKAEDISSKLFDKGLMTSAAITYPGKLDQNEADRVGKQVNAAAQGGTNKIIVISDNGKIQPLQISPADAQFIEQKKYSAIQIARIWKFPPYKLDPSVTSTWGSGIQEQNQNFVDITLKPWIDIAEAVINTFLLEEGFFIKFNLGSLLRGDIEAAYDSYGKAIYNGFMTPNEARKLADLPRDESGYGDNFQIALSVGDRNAQGAKDAAALLKLQAEIEKLKAETDELRKRQNPGKEV
ncbi:phage portal protein [Amycolatopsis sp. NPDC003731]